jgi:hypothetical protein
MENSNIVFNMYDNFISLFRFVGFDFVIMVAYRLIIRVWYEI